jgi:hypothetical protein
MAEVWLLSEGIRFIICNSEEATNISGSRYHFPHFHALSPYFGKPVMLEQQKQKQQSSCYWNRREALV